MMDAWAHRLLPLGIVTLILGVLLWPWVHAEPMTILGGSCSAAVDTVAQLWALTEGAGADAVHQGFPGSPVLHPPGAPLLVLLFTVLGPVLGTTASDIATLWNLCAGLFFALGALGALAFARRLSPQGPPLAHATAVLAILGSTAWAGMLEAGRIDSLPALLLPLGLAFLHRWMSQEGHWISGLGAMLLLTAAVGGRWQMSVFVMCMLVPMSVVIARRQDWRTGLTRLAVALVPAALLTTWNVGQGFAAPTMALTEPLRLAPAWVVATRADLLLPATATVALPSLGILVLSLAGVAARPKNNAGWLLCAAWGVLLAGGVDVDSWRGVQPAVQLTRMMPPLGAIGAWWEIAPLVAIPLSVPAMRGVEALHKVRRDSLALGALLIALVDQGLAVGWTERTQSIQPPTDLQAAMASVPAGAVLHLPRTDERCEARDRSILWQRTHGRAISASTTGDAAWRLSYLARLSEQQLAKPRPRPSADSPITSRVFHCAQADLRTLNDLGFSAVLLDKSVSAHLALLQTLQMVLGEPLLDRPELSLWSLPTEKNDRPPAACTLPTSAD